MKDPKRSGYKLRYSDIARILIWYYLEGKKEMEIAKALGVSQPTVSHYIVRYRKSVIRIIKKCDLATNNRIAFYDCIMDKLMKLIISKVGRKPRGRIRARKEAIQLQSGGSRDSA